MSEHIDHSILQLEADNSALEEQVRANKNAINALLRVTGRPARYPDIDAESRILPTSRRGDEFYGKALATVVREIMEERQLAGGGPATVDELYDAMQEGGYQFEASNPHNAKRGLRISLAKNTSTFHKLPNGKFGLLEWYPGVRTKPKTFSEGIAAVENGQSAQETATALLDEPVNENAEPMEPQPSGKKPR